MANFRETQEMLARVTLSESETQNAYRKIEDHLRRSHGAWIPRSAHRPTTAGY